MDTASAIRELSKVLFGSAYRLEAAAAIAQAEPGIVSVPQIADDLKLSASQIGVVRVEFDHFVEAGILLKLPRPRGQRVQEYERLPTSYWALARAFYADVLAKAASKAA